MADLIKASSGLSLSLSKKNNQKQLEKLAGLLYDKFKKEERSKGYVRAKEVLSFLAKGGYLAACLVAPGLSRAAPPALWREKNSAGDIGKYSACYLRRTLERLHEQKLVEIQETEKEAVVKITRAGRERVLRYALDEMEIEEPATWDGKWRLIIYDVPVKKRYFQDLFRKAIKKLGLYQLQKSVFLTPYPCDGQIEFLREYFQVGGEVLYMIVERFENDGVYKKYFGL